MRTVLTSIESEFRRYKRLGDESIRQLDAEALVRQPPGDGNSVAAIVWHIAGNLRSRFTDFLTTDGEKPWRDRESEFALRAVSPDDVRAKWEEGWDVLFRAVAVPMWRPMIHDARSSATAPPAQVMKRPSTTNS